MLGLLFVSKDKIIKQLSKRFRDMFIFLYHCLHLRKNTGLVYVIGLNRCTAHGGIGQVIYGEESRINKSASNSMLKTLDFLSSKLKATTFYLSNGH